MCCWRTVQRVMVYQLGVDQGLRLMRGNRSADRRERLNGNATEPIEQYISSHRRLWISNRRMGSLSVLLAIDARVVIFDQSSDPRRLRLIMTEDEIAESHAGHSAI
jgi:hypothetical protein